jgi:ribosomal protein L24
MRRHASPKADRSHALKLPTHAMHPFTPHPTPDPPPTPPPIDFIKPHQQLRNVKPRTRDEEGQQKRIESPIHHSNVMLYSQAKGVRSRVAYKVRVLRVDPFFWAGGFGGQTLAVFRQAEERRFCNGGREQRQRNAAITLASNALSPPTHAPPQVLPDGRKVRYLVKTGEEVPDRSFSKGAAPEAPKADGDGPAAPSS